MTSLTNHSQSVIYSHPLSSTSYWQCHLHTILSFAHNTFCILISYHILYLFFCDCCSCHHVLPVCTWLLFIDYSSAFNTIVPIKLTNKLTGLGLNTTLCDWIQDFLTGRPQVVKLGQYTSNSITLNVGAPQGCVLSPLLYSLYTHGLRVLSQLHIYYQICWWYCGSGPHFQQWWDRILGWGRETNIMVPGQLSLSEREQTKELIVDFRKKHLLPYTPLVISGTPVERVSSFKYLGVNISEDLSWTTHIQTQVRKARQRLYHLRQLRKFRVSPSILKTFYAGTIESVLTQCGMETAPAKTARPCRELCA